MDKEITTTPHAKCTDCTHAITHAWNTHECTPIAVAAEKPYLDTMSSWHGGTNKQSKLRHSRRASTEPPPCTQGGWHGPIALPPRCGCATLPLPPPSLSSGSTPPPVPHPPARAELGGELAEVGHVGSMVGAKVEGALAEGVDGSKAVQHLRGARSGEERGRRVA